ncbi:uncharacterized protein LOC143459677 [Clavelina lepadiformis]|uniref:uncharacterized protein LOC143459677 n=1 Tax=Clavelina lepadiformis TaxID=159417 RepID=UPI004042223B
MMEILENLPGITVERYTLMDRSYSFSAHETKQSKNHANKTGTGSHVKYSRPRRNSARKVNVPTIHEEPRHDRNRVRPPQRPQSRGKLSTSYFTTNTPLNAKIELEVLGKSAQHIPQASMRLTSPALEIKYQENEDTFPKEPTLKSILKRPGSGVSTRSSRSLGVMSLDSGMAKLAASLLQNKAKTEMDLKHFYSSKKSTKGQMGNLESRTEFSPDLQNLPHLRTTPRKLLSQAAKADEYSSLQTVSPSKSVTFKLEPEMQPKEVRRESDVTKSKMMKKGEARWGVALSSHQERVRERSMITDRCNFRTKSKKMAHDKRTVNNNTEKQSNCLTRDLQEKMHTKKLVEEQNHHLVEYAVNAYSSSALLRPRPDGGITGVSGIHLLSDPYRRYLMARAAEQSQRYALESKLNKKGPQTVKMHIKAKELDSQRNELKSYSSKANPSKASSLDKQYMALSNPSYKNETSVLPVLNSGR